MVTKTPRAVWAGAENADDYQPRPDEIIKLHEETLGEIDLSAAVLSVVRSDLAEIQSQDLDARAAALEALGIEGAKPKADVAVATTASISLSGEQTIDGVLTSASRILVKHQSSSAANGLYVTAAGAWSRATDMDAADEVQKTSVYVTGGTVNAGATFYTGSAVTTLGSDPILWVRTQNTSGLQAQVSGKAAKSIVQTIGLPPGSAPVTGSGTSASTYVFGAPAGVTSKLAALRCFAVSAGFVRVKIMGKVSNTFTQLGKDHIINVDAGVNEFTLKDLPEIIIPAGAYIGFYGGSLGVPYVNAAADSGGMYNATGNLSSFSDASANTSGRHQIGFDLVEYEQGDHLATEVEALSSRLGPISSITIGCPTSPVLGSATVADRVYVFANPATANLIGKSLNIFTAGSGTVKLRAFSKSGNTFTSQREVSVSVAAGLNAIDITDLDFRVYEGEHLGFYAGANTYVTESGGNDTAYDGGYFDNASSGGGDDDGFSDTSAATAFKMQLGIGFLRYAADTVAGIISANQTALSARLAAAEADIVGIGAALPLPKAFVIVWGVGQSPMSGRADELSPVVVPTGAGYKYQHSTFDLQPLKDPTGYDAGALADGGKGSFGPSLGCAVHAATHGRVGVIFVNTGYGGTSLLTDWASSGTRWTAAKNQFDNALDDILAKKLNIVGIVGLIAQGEKDGDNIDAATGTTKAAYKAAFLDLHERMKNHAGLGRLPLVVVQTGVRNDGDTTGYQQIRAAQGELVAENDGIFMGYAGAKYFLDRGLMMDTYHYNIQGNDEIGHILSETVLPRGMGLRPPILDE
ncbi:hypothetical protein P775_14290 [Puniceibacterium antarcticum]|uniref:Sialate O-acetylesterase domain-containing protein n=1 Tax=Puniceibacterium antarcticum TaxID=1206336 RepID=A0A2G8RD83_9RHOB|nr:sialate O-acetylesterase [Puniceibacterium antarcticum]PIL19519.1 hypothetical protein P775_14290 [Puniceibacterium antarcticum]